MAIGTVDLIMATTGIIGSDPVAGGVRPSKA